MGFVESFNRSEIGRSGAMIQRAWQWSMIAFARSRRWKAAIQSARATSSVAVRRGQGRAICRLVVTASVLDRERAVSVSISSAVIANSTARRHPAMMPLLVHLTANEESTNKSPVP